MPTPIPTGTGFTTQIRTYVDDITLKVIGDNEHDVCRNMLIKYEQAERWLRKCNMKQNGEKAQFQSRGGGAHGRCLAGAHQCQPTGAGAGQAGG
jgi:hypothetical protein